MRYRSMAGMALLKTACIGCLGWSQLAMAAAPATAASAAPSATDSLGRMIFGTVIVLLVIAAIAWILRRVMPGQGLTQRGVIKQVGGLQLGPRERVVVLEVAGRWLVVGIQGGQMTALGDLAAAQLDASSPATNQPVPPSPGVDPQASFAIRLQQAMQATLHDTIKTIKNKP